MTYYAVKRLKYNPPPKDESENDIPESLRERAISEHITEVTELLAGDHTITHGRVKDLPIKIAGETITVFNTVNQYLGHEVKLPFTDLESSQAIVSITLMPRLKVKAETDTDSSTAFFILDEVSSSTAPATSLSVERHLHPPEVQTPQFRRKEG